VDKLAEDLRVLDDVLPEDPERSGPTGTLHYSRVRPLTLVKRVAAIAVTVFIFATGWSIGEALQTPGTDTRTAKLAEWARHHDLGFVVNDLEKVQYHFTKPKKGGQPHTPIAVVSAPTVSAVPSRQAVTIPHLSGPKAIPEPKGVTPVAQEGQWQTVASVKGLPAVKISAVRPDATYTSVLVGVAWMDTKLTKGVLHPGTQEPGGTWATPSKLSPPLTTSVLAAFNSGFTLKDNRGGYYAEGREYRTLRDGAAAFVVLKDGTMGVGMWGRDYTIAEVASVRQNLDLLVDHGQVDPSVDQENTPKWGFTLGNKKAVPRSAVGVMPDGALVYVGGAALSTRSLAELCARIGMERAMELDINPEWVSYYWYAHQGAQAVPHKLTPDVYKPADRYFTVSTRDFISVHSR
jgi:hypothetical protein